VWGASYGGYSVFIWQRFTTTVSKHLSPMMGSTILKACLGQPKVFFSNWDFGGAYWEKNNATAQKHTPHSTR
jgi:hypothetical protein